MKESVYLSVLEDSEESPGLAKEALPEAGFTPKDKTSWAASNFESAVAASRLEVKLADLRRPYLRSLETPGLITQNQTPALPPILHDEVFQSQLPPADGKSRQALIESEERFRSLTALSSDWYWEQDENLRFTYVSPSLRDRYSEALESWAGKARWELPYQNADWTEHRRTVEARKPFHDVELRPFRRDGSNVYVSVSGEPQFDGTGAFQGYRGIGRDITEQVHHAEDLRRFRTAMDATLDSIALVDRATLRFVEVNATAVHMLGYSHAALLLLGPADVCGATSEQIGRAFDSLIAGEDRYGTLETRLRRYDKSYIDVEIRQHAQRSGESWIIVCVVRDYTERREADDRLKRLHRLYAMVSGINALVVRVNNRDELFANACQVAVEQGEFEQAWIGIVQSPEDTIVPMASAGLGTDALASIKSLFEGGLGTLRGKTLSARAIRNKAPVISNDVQNDEGLQHAKRYAEEGIRSLAVLPLIVLDAVVGVFVLYTSKVEFFDADGLKLLTELAGNVAFAMDNIEKQERLKYLAYYDSLTGLANRSLFLDRLAQYLRSAANGKHVVAVTLIDLERFKNINDSLGRPAGDELLQQVAVWLTENVGDSISLARIGADHFGLILPEAAHQTEVARRIETIVDALMSASFRLNDTAYRIAAKIGVALFPDDGTDADTLFKHAEAALKKAKVSGDRYLFCSQKMTETSAGTFGMENRLRQALEGKEFVLHYQPKVNILSGKVTGAEALLRWNDPSRGLIPPASFVSILEETGLIHEVGRWALRDAVQQYERWRSAGLAAVRISVNVSPLQLRNKGFVAEVGEAISVSAESVNALELEITESLIMHDVNHSIASLLAIRALGVTVAIDDFGTGYSSLSYLSKFSVDTLKIDRSFVLGMASGAEGVTLVSAIITLAHALKLNVVAEGVETGEQLKQLRALKCDEMQGYLFGKAVPGEDFAATYLVRPPVKPLN